jgi:hypothetical protein
MFYLRSEERVTHRPLPEFTSRGYNFFSSRQFRDAHLHRLFWVDPGLDRSTASAVPLCDIRCPPRG